MLIFALIALAIIISYYIYGLFADQKSRQEYDEIVQNHREAIHKRNKECNYGKSKNKTTIKGS